MPLVAVNIYPAPAVQEIADRLTKEFEVDLNTAKSDVHSMISKMQGASVIE